MESTNVRDDCTHLDIGKYLLRLQSGATGPDEYFCMVLSMKGPSETFHTFPYLIDTLQHNSPGLHKQLMDIYESYFVELQVEEDISYLGECGQQKQEDEDFQLALKLSLEEVGGNSKSMPPRGQVSGSKLASQTSSEQLLVTDKKLTTGVDVTENHRQHEPALDTNETYKNLMFGGYGMTDFNPADSYSFLNPVSQNELHPKDPHVQENTKTPVTKAFNPKQGRKRIQDGHLHSSTFSRRENRNTTNDSRNDDTLQLGVASGSGNSTSTTAPSWASLMVADKSNKSTQFQAVENNLLNNYTATSKEKESAKHVSGKTHTNSTTYNPPPEKINVSSEPVRMAPQIPGAAGYGQSNNLKKNKKSKGRKGKDVSTVERPLGRRPTLYWIRRDIRVYDNPALLHAFRSESPIFPVFIWSEREEGELAAGGATKLWLHHSLNDLNQSFKERYNSQITFVKTNSCLTAMAKLLAETGADTVVWNDLYEPFLKRRDDEIHKNLTRKGIEVCRFHSYLLHDPSSINIEEISMWGIGSVSHYMYASKQSEDAGMGLPEDPPPVLHLPGQWPQAETLEQLELNKMPRRKNGTIINWAEPIIKNWDFSENGAYEALQLFLQDGVRRYEKESSRGDQNNTARISPYLHFGQLSPRTVVAEGRTRKIKSRKFQRKLAWRDLSYWLLHLFPHLNSEPIRPHYKHQRWSGNKAHLKAWQKGNTGYPLVDAAMRELWLSGWCNNYMRHVVASFLISYLHLHWIEGYKWFQDTLLDADVAINAMMWQNGGMSGLDQWNFVMHPVDAAMTCDPNGEYVRKWIPALQLMPDQYIHKPWKCPPSILKRANVELGINYPHRIITDLEDAREQSLKDVTELRRNQGGPYICPYTGNDLIFLPNSRIMVPVITRKEFKYKARNPASEDNPHSAVLRGYRSRKRDELIAFENKVDFTASTMHECAQRIERYKREADADML